MAFIQSKTPEWVFSIHLTQKIPHRGAQGLVSIVTPVPSVDKGNQPPQHHGFSSSSRYSLLLTSVGKGAKGSQSVHSSLEAWLGCKTVLCAIPNSLATLGTDSPVQGLR